LRARNALGTMVDSKSQPCEVEGAESREDSKEEGRMRAESMAVVAVLVLALSAAVLPVSADDAKWNLRFGLLYSNPTGDFSDEGQTTELDDSTGIHASAEYRVNDLFGVEAGLGYAEHDIEIEESGFPDIDFGEATWTALTVNGNFHLFRDREVDLYAGPTIGYVFWGDIDTDVFPSDVSTDDEFAIGANLGIDVPLGDSPWAFSGALRYLSVDLGVSGGDDIGADPIQLKLGLSRSF
jgi:outer membrane protein W